LEIRASCRKPHGANNKGFVEKGPMRGRKKGDSYLKASAIMLLKTNIEKMSVLGLAIISMKTNGLSCACHYVNENKWA
jgi:hypothetical protein